MTPLSRQRLKEKEWRENNKEWVRHRNREYYLKNKKRILEQHKKHYRENKEAYFGYALKRRAKKGKATLSTSDSQRVEELFRLAKELTELTGVEYQVDHVDPLNGTDRSGLNVWWNMRVIPAKENYEKGNRVLELPLFPLERLRDGSWEFRNSRTN